MIGLPRHHSNSIDLRLDRRIPSDPCNSLSHSSRTGNVLRHSDGDLDLTGWSRGDGDFPQNGIDLYGAALAKDKDQGCVVLPGDPFAARLSLGSGPDDSWYMHGLGVRTVLQSVESVACREKKIMWEKIRGIGDDKATYSQGQQNPFATQLRCLVTLNVLSRVGPRALHEGERAWDRFVSMSSLGSGWRADDGWDFRNAVYVIVEVKAEPVRRWPWKVGR
jgi:hypothetical protein